jgi:hypothetical protein
VENLFWETPKWKIYFGKRRSGKSILGNAEVENLFWENTETENLFWELSE